MLLRQVDFDEIQQQLDDSEPLLLIGGVDVVVREFKTVSTAALRGSR